MCTMGLGLGGRVCSLEFSVWNQGGNEMNEDQSDWIWISILVVDVVFCSRVLREIFQFISVVLGEKSLFGTIFVNRNFDYWKNEKKPIEVVIDSVHKELKMFDPSDSMRILTIFFETFSHFWTLAIFALGDLHMCAMGLHGRRRVPRGMGWPSQKKKRMHLGGPGKTLTEIRNENSFDFRPAKIVLLFDWQE